MACFLSIIKKLEFSNLLLNHKSYQESTITMFFFIRFYVDLLQFIWTFLIMFGRRLTFILGFKLEFGLVLLIKLLKNLSN